MPLRIRSLFVFAIAAILLMAFAAAQAAVKMPVPAPPIIGAKSFLLLDGTTGAELASLEPDKRLAPASLTKLMTAYVIFRALAADQINLEDEVTVSEKAWRTQGSRMFIEVGSLVSVQDLLLGMIVQSGNDASVALAEYVAGAEEVFTDVMNQYAAQLGMTATKFMNTTGLPHEDHYSTARDLGTLANRNNLLWRDESVDGMKTGRTDDAGYCLISSASRDGMRVISVVLGTASAKARIDGSQALLNYGFRFFETRTLYHAGDTITEARIWKSEKEMTPLGLAEDLRVTIPRGTFDDVQITLNTPAILMAPVANGQPLAELLISLNGDTLVKESLRALHDNPSGSFWQRTRDGVKLWFE
jgi:D-alanyl-D-alanine carboxypeptidase (penicillin-binding protein 5/6)